MNSEVEKWVKSEVGRIHYFQDPCASSKMTYFNVRDQTIIIFLCCMYRIHVLQSCILIRVLNVGPTLIMPSMHEPDNLKGLIVNVFCIHL